MSGIDLSALGASDISGWDLLWAVLASLAGWIASIFVFRGLRTLMRRTPNVTESMALLVARIGRYLVILLGIGVGLAFLGVGVQPLLAIVIILGIVAVLVLRGFADNFAAGVMLQTRHPIKLGDEVQSEGVVGTVVELNGRSVVLHTVDGRSVHIPNSTMLGEPIVNHSARGMRRSEVQVRIPRTAGTDIPATLTMLTDAANSVDGVHTREHARSLAVTVSPDRLTARVQFWHHPLESVTVTSGVVLAVSQALGAAGLDGTVTSTPGDPPLTPPDPV